MYTVRPPFFYKKLHPNAVWRIPTRRKVIYLTFDDGPMEGVTYDVLSILKEYSARSTFFCLGKNIKRFPDIFNRIKSEGHVIGNHTFNHADGWKTGLKSYLKEIDQCDQLTHSGLFRPPYGKLPLMIGKHLNEDYLIIMWDVLSGDYDPNTSKRKCLDNVLKFTRPGSIVVFHDSRKAQEKVLYTLPAMLKHFGELGYSFEGIK